MTRLRTMFDLPLGVMRCVRIAAGFQAACGGGRGRVCERAGMMAAILLRVPTLAL